VSSQWLRTAPAGPPWTSTTIGAFPEAGSCGGESSQPCTSKRSERQVTLWAGPAGLFRPWLLWVSRCQAPSLPATTSGARSKASEIAATVSPSRAKAAPTTQSRVTLPASRQRMETLPPTTGTCAKAESPSTCIPKVIASGLSHCRLDAEPRRARVRFLAAPPAAGMTKTSPPFAPASLISPSMKAMFFPSGA
jgi:hypothetical protein